MKKPSLKPPFVALMLVGTAFVASQAAPASATQAVTTYHYDNYRTGWNIQDKSGDHETLRLRRRLRLKKI